LVNLRIIPSCKILCTFKTLRNFTGSTGSFLCKSSFYRHWFSTRGCLPVPLKSPQFPTTKQSQLHGLKNIFGVFSKLTECFRVSVFIFGVDQFSQQGDGSSTILCRILFWGEGGGCNRYYPNKLHITNSFHFPSDWMKSIWLLHHQIPKKKSWHTQNLREESCDFLLRPFDLSASEKQNSGHAHMKEVSPSTVLIDLRHPATIICCAKKQHG